MLRRAISVMCVYWFASPHAVAQDSVETAIPLSQIPIWTICHPSDWYVENSHYCSSKVFITTRVIAEEAACDYDKGYRFDGKCHSLVNSKFQTTPEPIQYYNYVYTSTIPCLPTQCKPGTLLSGCMRYTAGNCNPCQQALPANHYWSTPGTCDAAVCMSAPAGFYFTSPCGTSANTIIQACSLFYGNYLLTKAQYYCPGGTSLPVAVPDNARVTSDYTDFVCNDGYYRGGLKCLDCPLGDACVGGAVYGCPENYFSDRPNQVSCTRCAAGCTFDNHAPLLCPAGSTQDAKCVQCSFCGTWPDTGYQCADSVAMQRLPAQWAPQPPPQALSGSILNAAMSVQGFHAPTIL